MPALQITHKDQGLTLVLRERLGADALDAVVIHRILAAHIAKQIKAKDISKLPSRYWERIVFVANVIQQSVSFTGDDRFDIPTIDSPAEDIEDFYDFMMSLPERIVEVFKAGFRKFNAVPNQDGEKKDLALKSESEGSQSVEMNLTNA